MARVEFYAGTTLLATNTTTPYAFTWSAVPAGTYALKAIAYDADGGTTASPLVTVTVSAVAPAPAPSGLVTSLTEVGRFDLSADFAYGGRGLAYVPGSPEGLIVSGFGRWPLTAKVSIPTGGIAAFLQGLTDPTEGKSPSVNPSSSNDKVVGGYWAFGSQLLVSVFDTYDGGGTQVLSQFLRPLDLSVKGQVQGPCRAGPLGAGFYDGYVGAIPAEWQTRLGGSVMIGNGGLNVIGRTSLGPAAFATNPAQTCAGQNATPLVYYPLDHPTLGSYGTAGIHPVFNGTTRIDGVVEAVATSASPLNGQETAALQRKVAEMTGKTVDLRVEVDESLIGGLTVRVGDTLYDASVRGRLERLRERLVAGAR